MSSILKRISSTFLFIGLLGGLTGACVANTTSVLPEITFTHLQPLNIAVGQIRVEQSFAPSDTSPRIETRLNQPPVQVLRRWAKDRLSADISENGSGGFAKFIIQDARVTEQALDIDGNFRALMTNEQAVRYEATVEAVLEVQSHDGLSKGNAKARVRKAISIAENSTLNEREQALFDLVEGLMAEFDRQMENSIQTHLSHWVQ